MPTNTPRVPTPQRLIDAAYELFTRQGFHAVGLDRILADAGVSKQTFYNHFESKEDLMLAVLDKRSDIDLATFGEMLHEFAGDDPRAQLDAIWDVLDAWFNRDDFRGCIFITAAAEFPFAHDPAHQKAAAHAAKTQRMLADLARRAGAEDPQGLAERLFILIDGAFVVRHVTGNDRAAQIARENAKLMLECYLAEPQLV
jgi:AcrR family transcriptional regulator